MGNFWWSDAIGAGLEFDAVWRVPAAKLCEQEVFVTELCVVSPGGNALLLGVSWFFIKRSLALATTRGTVPISDVVVLTWCVRRVSLQDVTVPKSRYTSNQSGALRERRGR